MAAPGYLTTDPDTPKVLPRTRPGWAPRPRGRVKLVHGWATPEEGAGQDLPTRDDWRLGFDDVVPPPVVGGEDGTGFMSQPVTPPQYTPAPQPDLTPEPVPATTVPETGTSAPPPTVVPRPAAQVPSPVPTRAGVSKGASAPPPQGPPPASYSQQSFVAQNLGTALKIEGETGVPHQVLLAVPGNETGWGRVMSGNNYFGIKGSNPKTGANTGPVGTWEEVGGQRVATTDTFRAYGGYEESARDFVSFLQTNPRYAPALAYLKDQPNDWRGFIRRVHDAGYATDTQWSNKIVAIGNSIENGGSKTNTTDTTGASTQTPRGPLNPDRQTGKTGIQSVIDVGSSAIGTRYQWGGAGGRSSFEETLVPTDCSGFVAWAYQRATGIKVPAYTGDIYRTTRALSAEQAVPGDLVMFNVGKGAKLEHVGIYVGNGMMLHDSSLNPNGGVDITPMWKGAQFRRVLGVDPSQTSYSTPLDQPGAVAPAPFRPPPATSGPLPLILPQPVQRAPLPQPSRPQGAWRSFVPSQPFQPTRRPGAGQEFDPGGMDVYDPWAEDRRRQRLEADRLRREAEQREAEQRAAEQQAALQHAPPDAQQALARSAQAGTLPQDLSRGFAETAGGAFSGLGSLVRGAAETAAPALEQVGKAVVSVARGEPQEAVRQAVAETLPQVPGMYGQAFEETTSAADRLGKTGPQVTEAVTGAFQGATGALDALGKTGPQVVETVREPLETANTVLRAVTRPWLPGGGGMAAGVADAIDWVRNNGFDTSAMEAEMQKPPAPGSVGERVANGEVITNPIEGAALALEAWDKHTRIKDEGLKAMQPPEFRDTPEGWAARQALLVAADPLTYIGLPVGRVGQGAKTLQAIERAARVEQSLLRTPKTFTDEVAEALGRPYAEQETRQILGRAALDLNDAALEATLLPAAGKFEPLSGEQIRRAVMNAVARAEPDLQAPGLLKKVDEIMEGAGQPLLRSEAILGREIAPDVLQAGLPFYLGNAQQARLLEGAMRRSTASLDDAGKAALQSRMPASVAARFALAAGGGAAGFGEEMARGDPNDPNAWGKAFAKATTGFLLGASAPYLAGVFNRTVTPHTTRKAADWLRDAFAPMANLTQDAQDILRGYAGERMRFATDADLMEMEWREVFGKDANVVLGAYLEKFGELPPKYKGNPAAEQALARWRTVAEQAAANPDLIPEPLRFGGAAPPRMFIPHAIQKEWDSVMRQVGGGRGSGYVSRDPFRRYSHHRQFATLDEGMAHPSYGVDFTYEDNLPQLLGSYYANGNYRMLNQRLAENLGALADAADPSKLGTLAEDVLKRADVVRWPKDGWQHLNRPPGGIPIGQIDALAYWPQLENVYVSPGMMRTLENMFGQESSGLWDGAAKILTIPNQLIRHNVLSGVDFYHAINEMRQLFATQGRAAPMTLFQTLLSHTLPGSHNRWLMDPRVRASIRNAQEAGMTLTAGADLTEHMGIAKRWTIDALNALTGGIVGYQLSLQQGATQEEALRNAGLGALVGGAVNAPVLPTSLKGAKFGLGHEQLSLVEHITHTIFDRWVPFWKLTTFEMLANQYGNEKAAAQFVNQAFGGLNLQEIGRSRHMQDLMRMLILTPDWTESWARQFGNAFFNFTDAPIADMSRRYWATSAVQGLLTLEVMNQIWGGHHFWENDPDAVLLVSLEKLFDDHGWDTRDKTNGEVVTPYIDVLGPLKGIYEPLQLSARAALTTGYEKLGLNPQDLPREIRGDPGKIPQANWQRAWLNWATNRSGFLISAVPEIWNGKNYDGRPLNNEMDSDAEKVSSRIGQAASMWIPAGQSDLARGLARGDPLGLTVVSMLTGARTRRETASTRFFKARDDLLERMGENDQAWNDKRRADLETNKQVDMDIEALTNGTAPGAERMTARQRTEAIEERQRDRVTQRERLSTLVSQRLPPGPERDLIQQRLVELQQTDIISGADDAPVDLTDRQRAAVNLEAIFQRAWNRDPNEIARLKGEPRTLDWRGQLGELGKEVFARKPNYDEARALSNLRQRWLIDVADKEGIDPAVLQDIVKARVYQITDRTGGFTPPPLPGVSSHDLDLIVDEYQKRGRDDKGNPLPLAAEIQQRRQQYLFETAQQRGLDPQALTQRVQIRTMPLADATPDALSRRHASDVLNHARFYPYQNPDGTPFGTPKDWADWNVELQGAKTAFNFRSDPAIYTKDGRLDVRLTEIYRAQQLAKANKMKDVIRSQHAEDYYRWYGDGANMTDAEWKQYTAGTLDMWNDRPSPEEARNRNQAMRVWAALTARERNTFGIPDVPGGTAQVAWKIKTPNGQWQPVQGSLGEMVRFMNRQRTQGYLLDRQGNETQEPLLGEVDPIADAGVSSGGFGGP